MLTGRLPDKEHKQPETSFVKRKKRLYQKVMKIQFINQYLYIITSFLLFLGIKLISGLKMHQMINTLIAVPIFVKDREDYMFASVIAFVVNIMVIYLLSIFLLRFFIIKFKLDTEFISGQERFLYVIGTCFVHATIYVTVIGINLHLDSLGKEFLLLLENTFGRIIIQLYRMMFDMIHLFIPSSGFSTAITIFLFFGIFCCCCKYLFEHFLYLCDDIDMFNLICPFVPIFVIFTILQIVYNQYGLSQLLIGILVLPIIFATIYVTYFLSDWRGLQQFYVTIWEREKEQTKKLKLIVNKSIIENKNIVIFTVISFAIYILTELITKQDIQYFMGSLMNFNSVYDAENVLNSVEAAKTTTSHITVILGITIILSLFYDAFACAFTDTDKEYTLITERVLLALASNNVYLTIQLWVTFIDQRNIISLGGLKKVIESISNSFMNVVNSLGELVEKAGIIFEFLLALVVIAIAVLFVILLIYLSYMFVAGTLIIVFIKYVPFLLLYTIVAYYSQKYHIENLNLKFILYGATFLLSYFISGLQQKFFFSTKDEVVE